MFESTQEPTDSGRRDFLRSAFLAGCSLVLPVSSVAASDAAFWSMPRRLRLKRAQTGEVVEEVYWADGKLVPAGYLRICALLRDPAQNQAVYMDPRLLDLMRAVQAYVEHHKFKSPFVINSGYRSKQTNDKLEGAARNSMHLYGRAVDFSMPGLPSNYMGLLASHYKGGGVGFYPASGFTHIDTGNVRYWQRGRGTIGAPLGKS